MIESAHTPQIAHPRAGVDEAGSLPAQTGPAPEPLRPAEPQRPAQSTAKPSGGPSPKDLALSHLTAPSQRQLVQALAEQQALSDDHPIWVIVAMLSTVISAAPARQDRESALAQKGDIEALRTEIRALSSQTEALAAEVASLREILDSHLDESTKVISGAANLNRKIPEFLEGLKAVLLPKTAKPQR